jgi:sugar phosphate isomerase/epimerase
VADLPTLATPPPTAEEAGVKLGINLAGRRPDDIAKRLEQARDAGFSLCQLNLHQTGFTRADLVAIADAMLEYGVRPVSIGCYVNPLRPGDPTCMGTCRADLDVLLHCLDIIGARRIVLWSGTRAEAIYDDDPGNSQPDSENLLRDFLSDVVQETRARHYFLVIEPWRTHVLNSEHKTVAFHRTLPEAVAERVRYVLDAPNLITAERYVEIDEAAASICRMVGPVAGVVHLKDCIMPPDGEEWLPGPGQGKLNYEEYVANIVRHAAPDAPAVIRNVPATEYREARDRILRMNNRWELA